MLNTTINTNEISRFFKFELLDETIQFHEKLDKFDSMLGSILLPFDAELSPVNQQLFDITYNFLTEYHYKLTFNYDLPLLELKNAEDILMNFKCLVLKAFCQNNYSNVFLRKNRDKLRLIFLDILDYLKMNYPVLFYEGVFCKHKISFLNDYELTELFLNLNDLIYNGNLHKILDGDIFNDNFNTIQLWNDYCFSNYVFPCLDGEFNIDKKYFCDNADIVFRKAKNMKKEKVIHPDNTPSNKIEQILSTYENDLKPLEQELNFEPILDKFDAALDKIFCKEICDIISDDVVNLEISNIQCISKVVWKCINDFAAEIILSFIWAGLDTEESDAIIINLRCSLLGKLCELDHQDDSRSMCAWDFSMENQKKLRKIFIDSVDFLKEKVPLQIDEYGNIENILTDNYYYAHLFHQIDDMLYEKNLDNILEEDEEFSLFKIWGNYILKWDTNN